MNSTEILIQQITREISLYIPIALLIFDSCRCSCNFITFTSEELKTNSYALYFLCTAIIELPTFSFNLISRLSNNRFGSTLLSTNKIYCSIRSYLMITLLALISCMILLATIDRFISTKNKVRYRSCSQLKVAYRITSVTENYAIFFIVLLTYRNVTRTKRHIAPLITIKEQRCIQKTRSQLIAIMFGQAILSSFLDLTRVSFYSYFVLSSNIPK